MDNYDKIFNKTKREQAMTQADVDQIEKEIQEEVESWNDPISEVAEAGE